MNRATPSQTVGPFFSLGLEHLYATNLAPPDSSQPTVLIKGNILDGAGLPVPDAVMEIWQADSHGKYVQAKGAQDKTKQSFEGFGRVPTNDDGAFRFTTIKPGCVPGPGGNVQAPHLVISIFTRGLLKRLVTRIYFPNEPANTADFVLNLVEPERRATLIARQSSEGTSVLEWNVVLQGPDETVFFDC
ncbi:MAG TPA: protocatechuate 3,4-dioxygenase subunit alpha [Candidatus Dormibacteraeota bacterium]|nr:protocatechuate 3,4-dioxygenase subunit alpha [Candidatus Dormibacteraeota bacterium]